MTTSRTASAASTPPSVIMAGITYTDLAARTGDVEALTYMLAVRTFF